MSIYDIVTLLGFGFGTALTVILLSLSLQKKSKRYDDYAFGVVLVSTLLWNGGNFLSLLLTWLFGSVAASLSTVFLLAAYLGLVTMPGALVHVHLAIDFRAKNPPDANLSRPQILTLLAGYLPSLIFGVLFLSTMRWGGPNSFSPDPLLASLFTYWMLIAIVAALLISEHLTKILPSVSERHFHRDMSYILGGIGIGLLIVYVVPSYRMAYVGQSLNLAMILSPILPMAVLAYYVYRYNFYRLVVKPSLVYSIIYGLVMAIYLLGIRKLGEYLSQFPEVNATFIEGLLLVGLVFLFQPLRAVVQARLDRIFFRERYYYQAFLRELTESVSNIIDLDALLETIGASLTSTLKSKSCAILVLDNADLPASVSTSYGNIRPTNLPMLVNALRATREFRLRRQMRDYRVKAALAENQLALAVPVYYGEDLIGVICLAEKQSGNNYSDEELDILQTFANQIALALANARLVQERIDLEAQVYQSEKLNSLGLLATSIAHEIKNPLSSIKSILQVFRETAEPEARKDLDIVISEIDRLNEVLNRLLGFARPAETSKTSFHVHQVIDDVLGIMNHHARQSGVELSGSVPSDLPPVYSFRQNLRNVLFNLILNSIQAMPKGGTVQVEGKLVHSPDLRKSLTNISPQNFDECVEISVTDNGPGIKKEIINKIFEPFFSTKTIGTGLGMVIVKKDLEEMKSALLIESEANQGTQIKIYLPIDRKINGA